MQWRLADHAVDGLVESNAAAAAFTELVTALSSMGADEILELDASDVVAVQWEFVANAVGRVLVWFKTGFAHPTPAVLMNAGPFVVEAFDGVLREHDMTLLHCSPDGAYEMLGKADELADSTSAAQELGEFTLTQFAAHIGMTKQGADKRLRALVRAGALLRRVDGAGTRRSPIYQLPRLGSPLPHPHN